MENYYQLTIDDMLMQKALDTSPGRVAYIDECGGFGFDFSKEGTPRYYVLTAIVVTKDKIEKLHSDFNEIKQKNGFANTELKSSHMSDPKRDRIMSMLMPLEFQIVLFIVDKKEIFKDSPLAKYKSVFIKNMNNRLYSVLYTTYPKLKIMMDETGWPEFQQSFREYVEARRGQLNFLNQYDFDFVNSKDETLVQLADFIGGSITKRLTNPNSKNYYEMLRGKIATVQQFPNTFKPFWGNRKPEDYNYNDAVYSLAVKSARDFISKHGDMEDDESKAQVAALRYLLFYVANVNPTQYVYSDELINNIQLYVGKKIKKDFLFRRVIAPLRDSGVILASCVHGYKIPISVDDILTYVKQTNSIVGPMMSRMEKCRTLVRMGTDNNLDIFDDPAFLRYKRFFDDI